MSNVYLTPFSDWLEWFPGLGSRANYAKQSANLWRIKQQIQAAFAKQSGALVDRLHMADGLPMPVCHFKRAGFSSVYRGIATYGYCASKSETYYGFKGNLAISSLPVNITYIADAIRGHWEVENKAHWVLDVTWRFQDPSATMLSLSAQ